VSEGVRNVVFPKMLVTLTILGLAIYLLLKSHDHRKSD